MTDKTTHIRAMVDESISLVAFLIKKQYALSNIGLSDKVAFDWTRSGLYLEEKKTKGRRKYNAIEYVWLRLVKELREFSLPLESIRNLKAFLLNKVDLRQTLVDLMSEEIETSDELKEFQKYLKEAFNSKDELEKVFESNQTNLLDTVLCSIIHQAIILKSDIHLLIKKDGGAMVTDGEPFDEHINLGDILNGPYISYPLRSVLTDFIAREDLQHFEMMEDMIELTEQEDKILSLLREGGITSLTVKLKDDEIKLIETEENIDVKQVKGKLVDLIQRGGYQEISYKTENGKIVNLKRKTKYK